MRRVLAAIVFVVVLGGTTAASAAPTGYSAITGQSTYNLYSIDMATGTATEVGPFGHDLEVYGMAFSPAGVLHAIATDGEEGGQKLWTIDTATGAATLVGATGVGDGAGLAFTPDGRLWMTGFGIQTLYELDPATGAATAVADGALGADVEGLGADCLGHLYGVGDGDFPNVYLIDPTAGTAGALPSSYSPPIVPIDNAGMDFDASGVLWGITSNGGEKDGGVIFTTDTTTGAATFVADALIDGNETSSGWRGLAISAPAACADEPPAPVDLQPDFTG